MTKEIKQNASLEAVASSSFKALLKFHIKSLEARIENQSYVYKDKVARHIIEVNVYKQLLDDLKYFKALKKDSKCRT